MRDLLVTACQVPRVRRAPRVAALPCAGGAARACFTASPAAAVHAALRLQSALHKYLPRHCQQPGRVRAESVPYSFGRYNEHAICYSFIYSFHAFHAVPCGRGHCGSGGEPAGGVGCCTLGLGLGCDASCRRWGSPTQVKNLLPPEPPHVS